MDTIYFVSINQWQTGKWFEETDEPQYIRKFQLHLDELQDFYGSLAVGGHHHIAICFPADRRHELVDIFLFSIAVQERPDCVELELEQMLRESLQNGHQCDFLYCTSRYLIIDIQPVVF